MKNLYSSALRCNKKSFAAPDSFHGILYSIPLYFCLLLLIALLLTACKKESANAVEGELQIVNSHAANGEGDVLSNYIGLASQTMWELQQARAATAKYRNFDNAIKDGYVDINVIVPEMGYHYLNMEYLDATFDVRKPEILVYNKEEDGSLHLVAVEYAVPLNLFNAAPDGFTGSSDVWDHNTGFGLWLQHAWVWSYNPSGVFNPTNPSVHVH